MNTRQKGMKYEREVVKLLEKRRYKCIRPTWSKYTSKDFFGLFDIIAVAPHSRIRMIQVKGKKLCESEIEKLLEKLISFYTYYFSDIQDAVSVELWSLDKKLKKTWRIDYDAWRTSGRTIIYSTKYEKRG